MVAKHIDDAHEPACTQKISKVEWKDLPLSCPTASMEIWNAHPQVYLPIHRTGRETCEWCGTLYVLEPPDPGAEVPQFCNSEIEGLYREALARVKKEQTS
tara:strand:+ start:134 stop:433 length:300 start_codon:yes stop_codon:yes gene_type:complete